MTDLIRRDPDAVNFPPFETEDLRQNLAKFLDTPFDDPSGSRPFVGNYRWGVYAFFDYDGEPIYVGQTNERLRTPYPASPDQPAHRRRGHVGPRSL